MKEIALPASQEKRAKIENRLKRNSKASTYLAIIFALLAVVLLFGVIIVLLVAEMKSGSRWGVVHTVLVFSFSGGTFLCIGGALFFSYFSKEAQLTYLDFKEREDSEDSFYVGENTLARFEEGELVIFEENSKKEPVRVPYREMRFFSSCVRRLAREKGEWKVLLEIPMHYLAKKGKAEKDAPPALVETDYKPRLYRTLQKYSLPLLGEARPEIPKNKTFKRLRHFDFPDQKGRKRALLPAILGAVVVLASVPVAIFVHYLIGIMLGCFGVLISIRGILAAVRAKSMLAFYEEGMYWQDLNRADSLFLKWEEIEEIRPAKVKEMEVFNVTCAYGELHFPSTLLAAVYLRERYPEKYKEGKQ